MQIITNQCFVWKEFKTISMEILHNNLDKLFHALSVSIKFEYGHYTYMYIGI